MGGFAKVTNLLRDALLQQDQPERPREEVDEHTLQTLHEELAGVDINNTEEPGYEVISKVKNVASMSFVVVQKIILKAPSCATSWYLTYC